ncbi:flagellar filament capping protein FliD [Brevibacillus sp. SYSU BS000544]|uniref:flagellar filament capping protein FliD n=1 Tax=Brevibacillus sp. SYSU BS000544 TaxID=3416443 RepID=UPI003CE46EDD
MTTINSMRISGLASGMDTDTMVKDLMKAQRAPLDKLLRNRQQEMWRRDAYREMNRQLLDFRDNVLSSMRLQGTFLKEKAVSDMDSIVSVVSTGNANLSDYNIKVTGLATPSNPSTVIFNNALANENTEVGTAFTLNIQTGTGTKTVDVLATDTIKSMITKINDVSSASGATAAYTNGQITFTSTAKGTSSSIKVWSTGANNLGIGTDGTILSTQNGTDGQKLKVDINGQSYEFDSNTFSFDNITFTAKQVSATTVNVKVKPDEDAVFETIKKFVDKYNSLIETVNGKLSETYNRNYQPLLDEEKKDMSEKQIELWEEKAKSGLIRRDTILSGVMSGLRLDSYSAIQGPDVNSKLDTLSEIGITTAQASDKMASFNYRENGKLYIDETKLREKIRSNPEDVMKIFTHSYDSSDGGSEFGETGIAKRMYDRLNDSIEKLTDKAGSAYDSDTADYYYFGRMTRNMNKQIGRLEDRLEDIESRYYRQFAAMERAINQANSQSAWLTQQFAG